MSAEHIHHVGRFSWSFNRGDREGQKDVTKGASRRPSRIDFTGGLATNEEMLSGLYHGTYSGLQFASPLAFTPINVPLQMMGLPTPTSEDERTQTALDEITADMAERITKLCRSTLIYGTTWRWTRFDAETQVLVWEEIRDGSISDILLSITTGRPMALLTDEEFALSTGENQVVNVRRKRRFDLQRVTISWIGQAPTGLRDVTARNIIGMLPIAFAHDADEGEIRGHSAYSRFIRDLKDYHDIDYRASETLAKFRVKQKQTVKDLKAWLLNNFGNDQASNLTEVDIADRDLWLNTEGEDTEYEFLPEGATAAMEKALQRKFWKIVEGSGIPELFWGPLATGNHASTTEQMQQAVTYVDQLRRQWDRPFTDLYAASLRLLGIVRNETYQPFKMGWNKLEAISADVKSQIFSRFAQAISQIAVSASLTKKQLYTLWTLNYPESDPGTFEEFVAGLAETAKHSAFTRAPYELIFDQPTDGAAGSDGDEDGTGASGGNP